MFDEDCAIASHTNVSVSPSSNSVIVETMLMVGGTVDRGELMGGRVSMFVLYHLLRH